MNNPSKLKMSIPKFRAITIPVMAIFLVFALVLTVVTDYFTPSLDAFWARATVLPPSPTEPVAGIPIIIPLPPITPRKL